MLIPFSPELVVFLDFEFRTFLGTSSLLCSTKLYCVSCWLMPLIVYYPIHYSAVYRWGCYIGIKRPILRFGWEISTGCDHFSMHSSCMRTYLCLNKRLKIVKMLFPQISTSIVQKSNYLYNKIVSYTFHIALSIFWNEHKKELQIIMKTYSEYSLWTNFSTQLFC